MEHLIATSQRMAISRASINYPSVKVNERSCTIPSKLDKKLIQQRFHKAKESYDQHAIAQQQINRHLLDLLLKHAGTQFHQLLELGCGTGLLTQQLQQHILVNNWYINDLCDMQDSVAQKLTLPHWTFLQGDMEQITLPPFCDLIISASAIQWVQDKPAFLKRCAKSLKPKGWLFLSTFTADNLKEIRQLTGKGLNYPSLAQWYAWLSHDFDLVCCETKTIQLFFHNPMEVLRHLKYTGVTALQKTIWNRQQLLFFCKRYSEEFTQKNHQVGLTYTPLWIGVRKKVNK